MQKQTYNPKMMIKSKFSNLVNEIMNETTLSKEDQKKPSHAKCWKRKQFFEVMPEKAKLELLKKIFEAYNASTVELTNYLNNKKDKKKIQKLRDQKKIKQVV